jgi:hypothetical protein
MPAKHFRETFPGGTLTLPMFGSVSKKVRPLLIQHEYCRALRVLLRTIYSCQRPYMKSFYGRIACTEYCAMCENSARFRVGRRGAQWINQRPQSCNTKLQFVYYYSQGRSTDTCQEIPPLGAKALTAILCSQLQTSNANQRAPWNIYVMNSTGYQYLVCLNSILAPCGLS